MNKKTLKTSGVPAGKHIAANYAYALCAGSVIRGGALHRHTGEGLYIRGLDGHRTADGDLAAEINPALCKEATDGGEPHKGHRPDGSAPADGAYVADLNSDVAGGMPATESVENGIFKLVERSAGVIVGIQPDVNAATRKFGQGIDTGLESLHLASEGEFGIGGQGRRVESGNEDGLGCE